MWTKIVDEMPEHDKPVVFSTIDPDGNVRGKHIGVRVKDQFWIYDEDVEVIKKIDCIRVEAWIHLSDLGID